MVHIGICDDCLQDREHAAALVQRYAVETGAEISPVLFESGKALLRAQDKRLSLLLLDIEMPEMSGVETAMELRKTNPDVCIVFATNFPQYALQCYRARPFGYLIKPLKYEPFADEIKSALCHLSHNAEHYLNVKNKGMIIRVPVREILYAETAEHKVLIHTVREAYEHGGSLSMLEKELEAYGLFRCHTSFLINAAHVKALRYSDLTLSSGAVIPISKHRRSAFLRSLTDYLGGAL